MPDIDAQIQAFSEKLDEELREGALSFPTAWEVSRRIKELADRHDSSLEDMVAVVRAEPVLSAKVVSMANTVSRSSFARPITNVSDAVRRIGTAALRCLAFAVAAEQLCRDNRTVAVRLIASSLWLHAVDVAAWSYALSRKLKVANPDTAMFGGMMMSIGQFFLVSRVAECPALEADTARFSEFVTQWQEPVAHALLQAFELPESLVESVRPQQAYTGAFPPATLSEVLTFSSLVCEAPNPFVTMTGEPCHLADTPGIDRDSLAELLDSVRADRQQIFAAVRGS